MADKNQLTQEQQEMARLRQLVAEQQATIAKMQQEKTEEKKAALTVKVAKYGNGTISGYGFQRFPISAYVSRLTTLAELVAMMVKFAGDNKNVIRASMYAAEAARKAIGIGAKAEIPKLPTKTGEPKTTERTKWEEAWDRYYTQAMLDEKLVPSADFALAE